MSAIAHEYWLDPIGTHWVPGEELKADIRNGEEFAGNTLPFDPAAFSRAGLISDSKRQALSGRLGDYPAFRIPLRETGLHLLLLETTQRELRYDNYSDFATFLNYHGLQNVAARHQSRGLPQQNIIEHYYRYCKSLIDIEDRTIADANIPAAQLVRQPSPALAPQDQRLELIAQGNPMRSDFLRLQLQFEGKALAGRQIELFFRDSKQKVSRSVFTTDDKGFVEFAIESAGDYLVNSVNLVEPADSSVHWETLWASLTFRKTDLP